MRKYQRAIAHHLMRLDGVPRINKRIPGTRSSFFSLYWKGWQDKLIERYYSPKKVQAAQEAVSEARCLAERRLPCLT